MSDNTSIIILINIWRSRRNEARWSTKFILYCIWLIGVWWPRTLRCTLGLYASFFIKKLKKQSNHTTIVIPYHYVVKNQLMQQQRNKTPTVAIVLRDDDEVQLLLTTSSSFSSLVVSVVFDSYFFIMKNIFQLNIYHHHIWLYTSTTE